MARFEEWIKLRVNLIDDKRVRKMARDLKVTRAQCVGHLVALWCKADQDGEPTGNGHAILVEWTAKDVDDVAQRRGIHRHLPADWFELTREGLVCLNYYEKQGSTAKSRAMDARRQRDHRANMSR